MSNDNSGLFAAQPAISATGTLTFTPATAGHGSATITVSLQDDGGKANGGADTSAPQAFTITVNEKGAGPVIQTISVSAQRVTLLWTAVAGTTYRVQYKSALDEPSWKDLADDVEATAGSLSKVDQTIDSAASRFYRIMVVR